MDSGMMLLKNGDGVWEGAKEAFESIIDDLVKVGEQSEK
jgi:hypothetical protein